MDEMILALVGVVRNIRNVVENEENIAVK